MKFKALFESIERPGRGGDGEEDWSIIENNPLSITGNEVVSP